jgi:hypothetical protein
MCCGSFFFRILHYTTVVSLLCGIHASRTLSLCSFAQTFDNVRFIDPVQNGVWGSANFYCKGVESGVASGNTFLFHLALRTKQAIE